MTDTVSTIPAWLSERLPQVTDWEARGTRRWRGRVRNEAYGDCWCLAVCDEGETRFISRMLDVATAEAAMFDIEARTFDKLEAAMAHELLPTCVAPDCDKKAPMVFVAAEGGRLAGRVWLRGDEIRLCPDHGNDVYQAQGVYGVDQLAEWLRADARLEPLDAFDAEVSYDAADWVDSRRRMLAMAPRGAGFSGTSATAGRATDGPAAG